MLIEDLYTYEIGRHSDREIRANITVNKACHIYEGHFPGMAVTPGVCQLLMIKEILEETLGLELQLSASKYLKFLAVHQPDKSPVIQTDIIYKRTENGQIRAEGMLHAGESRFLKMKGEFTKKK